MRNKEGYRVDEKDIFDVLKNPRMIKSFTREQQEQEKKNKENTEFVKREEYIKWLVNIVKENGYVSDSPSFPPPHKTKEDAENIKKISYLYRLVDSYASDNYYPESDCYNIKYEDTILELKIFMGQGGMCFIKENDEAKDYLLFEDIVSNKKTERKDRIAQELNEYKEYLSRLLDDDVPEHALLEVFDDTVKKYKKER